MARSGFVAAMMCLVLVGCSPTAPRTAENTRKLSGKVVERVDSPPYSFVRIESREGETWIAVPLTSASSGEVVELVNGVTLRNYEAPAIDRKFDTVVFGTLAPR
jgi:hypothetical protein